MCKLAHVIRYSVIPPWGGGAGAPAAPPLATPMTLTAGSYSKVRIFFGIQVLVLHQAQLLFTTPVECGVWTYKLPSSSSSSSTNFIATQVLEKLQGR